MRMGGRKRRKSEWNRLTSEREQELIGDESGNTKDTCDEHERQDDLQYDFENRHERWRLHR